MGAMVIGFVLGLVLGASTGSLAGAYVGGVLGMSIGFFLHAFGWVRARLGDAPTLERHRLMCTPHGTIVECELLGDVQTKRWLDVRRCSLANPDTELFCDKMCLRLMNDSGVRPGQGCRCEE